MACFNTISYAILLIR